MRVAAPSEPPDVFDTAMRRAQQAVVFIEQQRRTRRVVVGVGQGFEYLLSPELIAGYAVLAVQLKWPLQAEHHPPLWRGIDPAEFRPAGEHEIDREGGDRGNRLVGPAPAHHGPWLA